MVGIGVTFQGVRYALFSFHRDAVRRASPIRLLPPGGAASARLYAAHSVWQQIVLSAGNGQRTLHLAVTGSAITGNADAALRSPCQPRTGRIASARTVSAFRPLATGISCCMRERPPAETFQWIETLNGDLTLMSLATHRYLRVDFNTGAPMATVPPRTQRTEGVRFDWHASPPRIRAARRQEVKRNH